MSISINTTAKANLSRLSKDELATMIDQMDGDNVLAREELASIAQQLLENDKNTFDNHNLSQMVYLLTIPKVNLKHVQNVLLDYATRAAEEKVEGGRSRRQCRKTKTRRTRRKVRRTTRIQKRA